ncbi:hypothetical protein CJS39_25010 [Salmonella enterica subsp. enterica serovar Schwarzengrund]|nr:hypothetical protein CJS39_25010 [Salmonella enterica subsp. enterica serovar Schwarzengrund]
MLHNPEGYDDNLRKAAKGLTGKSDKHKNFIHSASCLCLSSSNGLFTNGEYQKICSSSFEKAEALAKYMTGLDEINRCSFCFGKDIEC